MESAFHMEKRYALRLIQSCGIFAVARYMSAKAARILMYHNFCGCGYSEPGAVNVDLARRQLENLRRHFRVIALSDVFERLGSDKPLDHLTVALTIDDGRRNCYEFLFPLLKEFQMPATFFVVSSFIRREDWLWTDKVLWLSEHPGHPSELSGKKINSFFEMLNRMRPDARNACIAAVAAGMGVSIPGEAPAKYAPCSWSELREMADSGLVEIGSHTVTHPILAGLTDEESRQELTVSRIQIEEGLGRKVRSFCFPNGKPSDYRPTHLQQIRDAGYVGAVTACLGMVQAGNNVYELPRLGVSGDSDALSFAKSLDGVEHYQVRLQKLFGRDGRRS
jgi:peptidoglycan/xylan/chitin deacetylase (PgdA/CDA1 family)